MRVFLLILTNLAVIIALGVLVTLLTSLGVLPPQPDENYISLLIFCSVLGFGGAFISLLLSKTIAKMSTGAKIIDQPKNQVEQWLVDTVARFAKARGIGMPEVAIFPSPAMNAFATGARRDASLVAVSTGLLNGMSKEEAEAVIGHEITHVSNGDMVTLTLLQGVTNTFVYFFSFLVAKMLTASRDGDRREGSPMMEFLVRQVLIIGFGWIAGMIVAAFSRRREFRADAGGAELQSPRDMADALRRLQNSVPPEMPASLQAFGIQPGIRNLFATHPPLEERIARLEGRA